MDLTCRHTSLAVHRPEREELEHEKNNSFLLLKLWRAVVQIQ